MFKKESNHYRWKEFFELISKTKPKVGLFIIACIISSASAIATTFIPNFVKTFIDSFSTSGNLNGNILLLLGAFFIFGTLTSAIASYLLNVVGLNVVANLRGITWSKIVKLPANFYDKNKSGDIASRVVNDTTVIFNLVSHSFSQFVNAILTILFCSFWLFYYDWQLALVILIAIPLFLLFFVPLGRVLAKLSKRLQRSTARLNVNAFEMISEIKLVKSFTAENAQIKKGMENIKNLKDIGMKQATWMALVNPILNLIMMLMIITIVGYGGIKLARGDLSPGTFIAFLTLIFYVIPPISNFGTFFTQLQKTKGATERISQLLNEDEENLSEGKFLHVNDQDIELKNISFHYSTQEDLTFSLQDINLKIAGGETYALVGPSGSGKTTLIALLERFYQPTNGAIYMGGENIESFSLSSWRSQIGYVSQEHTLVSGTIRENIIFGLEGDPPSEKKIVKACKMAYAWEFVRKLPNGLDTDIGERGLNLSGGQRQRIAIARMFLKDPKIILLDEATANLDSQSEKEVHAAMQKITKNRTAIVIAHRLSTVMNSDHIIFMEDGKITGQGKHDELRETHELYRKFCKQQLESNQEQTDSEETKQLQIQ
ncbi:ATP-binding cassette, subfamily B, AbcA/BmrA [Oceanobacillus limi]|uniref:ATP-binding cassette, subfamily B, AbcA/BmrA n=1 Tax=Oceanobacillus limi TaxID=930131 RepID=A0A1I0EQZ5_9BACI|nr:ABC transporter ATP-binding protein [Oceanobacillus limi]SET47945.1 ATP-binding cassette, subfamily B, AbcA/BmrA [Oceanobacillus limi]